MSDLETMIDAAEQQVQQHQMGHLRQRIAALLTPEAQRVLELRFATEPVPAAVIQCLGVPCWLRPTEQHGVWEFGSPMGGTLIQEDKLFESRVLAHVGQVKLMLEGVADQIDPKMMN